MRNSNNCSHRNTKRLKQVFEIEKIKDRLDNEDTYGNRFIKNRTSK